MYLEIALFFLLLLVYAIIKDRKPPNMPPGPVEIPFIGGIPFFDEKPAVKLQKKYGDIVSFRTGNFRNVFLFDYRLGKDVMGRQEFTGRPSFFKVFALDPKETGGVISSNGAQWVHDRRFVLRNLRNLGMGKNYLEEAINTEAQALVEDLKKYDGQPINFPDSFRTAVLNIIWQMISSRRYDLRSEEVDSVYKAAKEFQDQSAWLFLPFFMPILQWVVPKPLRNIIFREDVLDKFVANSSKIVNAAVKDHEADFDADNPRDMIDEYLKGMKEEKEGKETFFRKGALLQIINDMFIAGSDTVNQMIKWTAFLLARYPEIAHKLQEEIEREVGSNRIVSLDDKPNLPLVEAFTVESLRYSSMVVQNVQRTSLEDTTIGGYSIPKGTDVIVMNYSVHHDPHYWKQPEKFMPERHIDQDGKFQLPREGFFAFGAGRRQCAGESLARMELFLFTAAIIQNFNIRVADGHKLTDNFLNKLGLRTPQDVPLIYEARL